MNLFLTSNIGGVKKENGKMREYLDISYLYERLTAIVIEDEENENHFPKDDEIKNGSSGNETFSDPDNLLKTPFENGDEEEWAN